MDKTCQILMTKLEASKVEAECMEKQIASLLKENMILKRYLHQLTEFAKGQVTSMPVDWNVDERNNALRMKMRVMLYELGECNLEGDQLSDVTDFVGENLESLIRFTLTYNKNLEEEISKCKKELDEQGDRKDNPSEMTKYNPLSSSCIMSGLSNGLLERMYTVTPSVSVGSLGSSIHDGSSAHQGLRRPSKESEGQSSQHVKIHDTHEPFNEREYHSAISTEQIHEIIGIDRMNSLNQNSLNHDQPCQITISGLGWGMSNTAVVEYVRKYEGFDSIKIDGDVAVVQFKNAIYASKFGRVGQQHDIKGRIVDIGSIQFVQKAERTSAVERTDIPTVRVKPKRRTPIKR